MGTKVVFQPGAKCNKPSFKDPLMVNLMGCNPGGTTLKRPMLNKFIDTAFKAYAAFSRSKLAGVLFPLARWAKGLITRSTNPDANGFPRMGPAHSWAGEALRHNQ